MKKRQRVRVIGTLPLLVLANYHDCWARCGHLVAQCRGLVVGVSMPRLLQAREDVRSQPAIYAADFLMPSTRASSFHVLACRALPLRGGASPSSSCATPADVNNPSFELPSTTAGASAAATAPASIAFPDSDLSDETSRLSPAKNTRRQRHRACSDVIQDLLDADRTVEAYQQHDINEELLRESIDLRLLIMERTRAQVEDISEALELAKGEGEGRVAEEGGNVALPDPRRLLSYLAPKVPAIRNSPDASLKVQCNVDSPDPGLASAVLAGLARACLVRDRAEAQFLAWSQRDDPEEDDSIGASSHNFERSTVDARRAGLNRRRRPRQHLPQNLSILITRERRFEQLVECVLCGVDVSGWMNEYMQQRIDHGAESIENWLRLEPPSASVSPTSEIADGVRVSFTDALKERPVSGLAIRDAIRAAWGLSLLIGSHQHQDEIGGEKTSDIFVALSLHIRASLVSQLQQLRVGDLSALGRDVDGRIALLAEQLAEDAASALWAFGCVAACTGLRFTPLFEVACVVLCQNPFDLRKRAQDAAQDEPALRGNVGASDVVDRLAEAEEDITTRPSELVEDRPPKSNDSRHLRKDVLLDYLSPSQATDVLWALALHGSRSQEGSSLDEIALSEPTAALRDVICDRMIAWLHEELEHIKSVGKEAAELDDVTSVKIEAAEEPARVENMTIGNSSGGGRQSVKVIDAAALLGSEASQPDDGSEDDHGRLGAPSQLSRGSSLRLMSRSNGRLLQRFSLRDLCSIAWAVTVLHDSLQPTVTHVVISIFLEIGESSMNDLEGSDLSNLAWAVAKSPKLPVSLGIDSSLQLVSWVCKALVPVTGNFLSLLRLSRLQPPELGRLVWAVSTVFTSVDLPFKERPASSSHLALAAMHVAKANFSEYGPEDLARIAWGFMELGDMEALLDIPDLARSLGTMLSMIKSALLDWESGALQPRSDESYGSRNPFSFSSFFGRARFLAQLLDQRTDQPPAEEGDEFSPSILTKRTLPLLKDFPLDPSTLCKITSSFGKLRVGGGEAFARVALRLMTSRSGRLLQECPMNDIVRLCETVASGIVPLGRERVSLFVRKLVLLFNTEWATRDTYTLTSEDAAVLIWSLGELGVKCVADSEFEGASSAHRRLQLVGRLPVDIIATRVLSTANALRLLTGLMSSHQVLTRPDKALEVLDALVDRVSELSGSQVISLAEVVAKLRYLITELIPDPQRPSSDENDQEQEDSKGPIACLATECDRMLSLLARTAAQMVGDMSPENLRRLISVYTLSPFRADELVAAASREVEIRLDSMEFLSPDNVYLESQLKSIACRVSASLRRFDVGEATGFGATIRKGLSSFFGVNEKVETEALNGDTSEAALIEDLRNSLLSIVDLSERLSSLSRVSRASIDGSCRSLIRNSAFELGRCRDLIDHYSRIDFETGDRRSRHVHDDKRRMAKQVLSRLLP